MATQPDKLDSRTEVPKKSTPTATTAAANPQAAKPAQTRPSIDDLRKRQKVFFQAPDHILLKITCNKPIPGLQPKVRDEEAIKAKQLGEAEKQGLNAHAYRAQTQDTGFQLFNAERGVKLTGLLEQLIQEEGYVFTDGHFFRKGDKVVNVIALSREGKAKRLPIMASTEVDGNIFVCTTWCNLNYAEDGTPVRTDTINCSFGKIEPGTRLRTLRKEHHTYRLK